MATTTFKVANVKVVKEKLKPWSLDKLSGELLAEVDKQVQNEYMKARENLDAGKESTACEMDQMHQVKAGTGKSADVRYEFGQSNFELVACPRASKHAFMDTVTTAYNKHLPLEFSVDDIWTLIAQGVASYLGGDTDVAERYRSTFVDHQGKKQLVLLFDAGFLNQPKSPQNAAAWPVIINLFADKIKENTKTDLSDIMATPFSTTGPVEQVVFSATLMETMKNYFEYKAMFLCGIPNVTIHGTKEDFENILAKIKSLKEIFVDFLWWLEKVEGHVGKMLDSVNGKPDSEWWNRMVFSEPMGSGGQTSLSGWIGDFIPFYDLYGKRIENRNSVELDDLNYALSMTDVVLQNGMTGERWQIKVVSGFLGMHQDKQSFSVRPALGWMTYYDATSDMGKASVIGLGDQENI